MSHTRLWTSAAIIAVVILIGFVLSVPHARDLPRSPVEKEVAPPAPAVTIHDAYKKGVHTITGSLVASNACTSATAIASLIGSASSTQTILVSISMPEDTGVCLQGSARINFSAILNAKTILPIQATVNGVAASTTPI